MQGESEFRRGWPVLLASLAGVATGIGAVPFYSLGPSMMALEAEFGWSRTMMSFALTCIAATLFVMSPIAGWLCDRVGVRRVAIVSALALAPSLAALSLLNADIWLLFVLYGLIGVVAAGTSPVTYSRALASWFDRKRGLALGIALTGTGIAGALIPQIIHHVTVAFGWRAAWLAIGALPLMSLPLLLVALREKPAPATLSRQGRSDPAAGFSQREALADRRFWIMGGGIFIVSLFIGGFVVHMVPMLSDDGVSAAQAARIASLIGVAVILSRLSVGWLLDHLFAPVLAAAVFAMTAGGCLLLAVAGSEAAVAAALFIGFALGAEVDLIAYMVARYFGLRSYGAIYGWQYSFFVAGTAVSPLIVGFIREAAGSYTAALYSGAATIGAASLLFLLLGPYRLEVPSGAAGPRRANAPSVAPE